jgi:hypothetical protein
VVFLSDGAPVLQNLALKVPKPKFEGKCRQFVMILDLLHVITYLWKAAYGFHPEGSHEVEEWVGDHLRRILRGEASAVADTIRHSATERKLRGKKRQAVDTAADYILRNKDYMCYDGYLALGLPIASGVIEGTCKHLVKDRFEIAGARWGLEGGEALLKLRELRAIYQSGDWDEYWQFHVRRDQERIHPNGYHIYGAATEAKSPSTLTLIQGGKSS